MPTYLDPTSTFRLYSKYFDYSSNSTPLGSSYYNTSLNSNSDTNTASLFLKCAFLEPQYSNNILDFLVE